MNFFFDRCMAVRIARIASALEGGAHNIIHHNDDERFTQNTPDTEWLAALARDQKNWIVLSADGRILKNSIERIALSKANLTFFVFADGWPKMSIYDSAWKFVKIWPEIIERAKASSPTIFSIQCGKALKIEVVERSRKP